MKIGIVFPHQLFEQSPLLECVTNIYLVEEWLFFKQYRFHRQKIAFHRASMKFYEQYLRAKGLNVIYIAASEETADVRKLIPYLQSMGGSQVEYLDTTDEWLERRIQKAASASGMTLHQYPSQLFINSREEIRTYFNGKTRLFQTDFYKHQRLSRNILLEANGKPLGGKWTYDEENRLKYPKGKVPPVLEKLPLNDFYREAISYTETQFPDHYGKVNPEFVYPVTFEESRNWLHRFLKTRLEEFGPYEDALVAGQHVLHHSVLTPILNIGLITPQQIVAETLEYASNHAIPLNSLEGFIRQVIGWREFIRVVYELKGTEERTKNYWGFTRKIPASFWKGTTGIAPIDLTIKKVLETGYAHHIERLMVLGNFMLLCEFDPDEVYRWFMELFIDSYDWVMVPNVYGMSQFADGGLMSTKPYISGSNYLLKMSDFPKGEWQTIWDGLFWRFMHVHRDFFLQNPRLGMLVTSFDKMDPAKKQAHVNTAETYLNSLEE